MSSIEKEVVEVVRNMRRIGALVALLLVLVALPLGGAEARPTGQEGQPADQPRYINIRGERLIGLPIINREGEVIGEVGDVLVNLTGHRQSGDPARPAQGGMIRDARADYVLAQFGGVLGWDRESVPLPFAALRLHLVDAARLGFDDDLVFFEGNEPGEDVLEARRDFFDRNALVLVSERELDNVPKFDVESMDDVNGPAWDQNLRAYWQGLGAQWPQGAVENGAAYRVSSVRNFSRFGLRELGGDGLGGIDDVLLTLAVANPALAPIPTLALDGPGDENNDDNAADNGRSSGEQTVADVRALAASLPILDARVHYALVNHGGWWGLGARTAPVPFGALMMDRDYDERSMYLEADDDLLDDAPAIDSKDGNELNDENFFTRVRAYWQEAGFGPFER